MKLLVLVAVLIAVQGTLAVPAITLTGDAFQDFAFEDEVTVQAFLDPTNYIADQFNLNRETEESDVGVPDGITARSGWDVRATYINYDIAADTLQVGIDCYGICGDADGNGDEATEGSVLQANGGWDNPSLASSETFGFLLDAYEFGAPEDFEPTLVVGFEPDIRDPATGFGVYYFDSTFKYSPGVTYDGPVAGANADAMFPESGNSVTDIEFNIYDFTTLPGFEGKDGVNEEFFFKFHVFAGSFEDDGIGEDNLPLVGEAFIYYFCPEDECGICLGSGVDVCGYCPSDSEYGFGFDDCGYCLPDPSWGNHRDACGICDGPGTDDCGLCPSDPEYEMCPCCGCDDIPNSGKVYDICGICDGPDDPNNCCEIESYKGYFTWELDQILTFYNTADALNSVCVLETLLADSLAEIEDYVWTFSTFDTEPAPFCDYFQRSIEFDSVCVLPFLDSWLCLVDELSA